MTRWTTVITPGLFAQANLTLTELEFTVQDSSPYVNVFLKDSQDRDFAFVAREPNKFSVRYEDPRTDYDCEDDAPFLYDVSLEEAIEAVKNFWEPAEPHTET